MPIPRVTVAVPTLAAGDALADCLRSLESQTVKDFEVVVIDNSGAGLSRASLAQVSGSRARVIANARNVGFGAAVNQAYRESQAPFLVVLNDDATAHADWLEKLLNEAEAHPRAGMFASHVRIAGSLKAGSLKMDSAGMLMAADGSSKQRGHGHGDDAYFDAEALFPSGSALFPSGCALFPSGCAAMYRREMLQHTGAFDESFFLYCEDADLGLRARWMGWDCRYVETACVDHRYSHSAGRASTLKAYYVERNRLYTVIKNFPLPLLAKAACAAPVRYFWHVVSIFEGRGKAAEFRREGSSAALLPWLVLRAHWAALAHLPALLRQRRKIFQSRRISSREFARLLKRHSISLREVAAL